MSARFGKTAASGDETENPRLKKVSGGGMNLPGFSPIIKISEKEGFI